MEDEMIPAGAARRLIVRFFERLADAGPKPSGADDNGSESAEPTKRKRSRLNPARYIRQARKAGEKGPVTVEITDTSGRTVKVTSQREQDETASTGNTSDLGNPWDEVKRATH